MAISRTLTPPYLVSIATELLDTHGEAMHSPHWEWLWTPEFVLAKRELVGKWSQFYVGGFANYSDELWASRVTGNLTNRLSELQFIRPNSALIYMTADEWAKHHGYMEEHFIRQILQIRAIHLMLYLLNAELSTVQRLLTSIDVGDISSVQREIDRVRNFDDVMSSLTAQFYEKRLINRRQHSRKVLNTMIRLLDLDNAQAFTAAQMDRVKARVREANDIAIQVQQARQKESLNLINYILGSEVLVSLGTALLEYFGGLTSVLGVWVDGEPSFSERLLALLAFGAILGAAAYLGSRLYAAYHTHTVRVSMRAKRSRALRKARSIGRWRALARRIESSPAVSATQRRITSPSASDGAAPSNLRRRHPLPPATES